MIKKKEDFIKLVKTELNYLYDMAKDHNIANNEFRITLDSLINDFIVKTNPAIFLQGAKTVNKYILLNTNNDYLYRLRDFEVFTELSKKLNEIEKKIILGLIKRPLLLSYFLENEINSNIMLIDTSDSEKLKELDYDLFKFEE
tara:strand:- start:648 stop:1076 length:429 start_codon:yes stop_codon:yes gene_type:complete